jgi:hypothetical protein
MSTGQNMAQQSVIVHFKYPHDNLDELYELEDRLEALLVDGQIGDYDGHEIATDYSDGFLYLYGNNAEELFNSIKPVLEDTDFTKQSVVRLVFGHSDSDVREIEIGR